MSYQPVTEAARQALEEGVSEQTAQAIDELRMAQGVSFGLQRGNAALMAQNPNVGRPDTQAAMAAAYQANPQPYNQLLFDNPNHPEIAVGALYQAARPTGRARGAALREAYERTGDLLQAAHEVVGRLSAGHPGLEDDSKPIW